MLAPEPANGQQRSAEPATDAVPPMMGEDQAAAKTLPGSFRLMRLAGTEVYVHWTWFIAAYFLLRDQPVHYSSFAWTVVEYVAGFVVVLLHEFGHVIACRRVGGIARRVLLWPLGGLAFVAPPPRPGALFQTIAAGPLVNVILFPILLAARYLADAPGPFGIQSDTFLLLDAVMWFNVAILVFNLLPVYPLDGGQMLNAILWKLFGQVAGLYVSALIGLAGGILLAVVAFSLGEGWLGLMAGFLVLGALGGIGRASLISRLLKAERRTDVVCASCGRAPPIGQFWRCHRCMSRFNLFAEPEPEPCPKGGHHMTAIACVECGSAEPFKELAETPASPEAPHAAQ